VIAVYVTFSDGNILTTRINATIEQAIAYYIGQYFTFDELKPMVYGVTVEEIK
jgi:hypothetical protein